MIYKLIAVSFFEINQPKLIDTTYLFFSESYSDNINNVNNLE